MCEVYWTVRVHITYGVKVTCSSVGMLTRLWPAARSVCWPGCDLQLGRYVNQVVTCSSVGMLTRLWPAARSVCWPGCDLQLGRYIDHVVTCSPVDVLTRLLHTAQSIYWPCYGQNYRGILDRIPKPPFRQVLGPPTLCPHGTGRCFPIS